MTDEEQARYAVEDLADVAAAHAVVVMSPTAWLNSGSGGRHVEVGYALGLGMPIVLLGVRGTVFHYLKQVRAVDGFSGLLDALQTVTRGADSSGAGGTRPVTSASLPSAGGPTVAAPATASQTQPTTGIPVLVRHDPAAQICGARDFTFSGAICIDGRDHAGEHTFVQVP
jgi:hypothetical protein